MARTKYFVLARDEGAKRPGDCGSPFDQPPEWYDEEKMRKAADVFSNYSAAVLFSHLLGTVIMSQVASLVNVLLLTGEHATPLSSEKRAVMTTYYVRTWYAGRIQDEGDQGRKNVKLVRNMHSRVYKKLNAEQPPKNDDHWLSQYDMALTQFAFVGALVLNPQKLGFYGTIEEIEDVLYYWRYIGYLLGIEERFNLCSGNYEQIKNNCEDIRDEVVKPTLSNPQPLFTRTIQYAFMGFSKIGKGVRYESLFNYSCDVISYQDIKRKLNLRQLISYWFFVVSIYFMRYPSFRAKANYRHNVDSGLKIESLIREFKKRDINSTTTTGEELSPKKNSNILVKLWKYLLQFGSIIFEKLRKEHEM